MEFLGLTRGFYALVDAEDYERLKGYNWHVVETSSNLYGARMRRVSEGGGGGRVMLHHAVLGLEEGLPTGQVVDYINGVGLDYRKGNLRLCDYSDNGANRRPNRRRGRSKYKGGQYVKGRGHHKGGWAAVIKRKGKKYYLGCFGDELSAVKKYNMAAFRLFGRFAYLNRWEGPTEGHKG
ncbi:MAG: hypothetical protein AMJ79_10035 [Phycisphaerae bacterium SM23_30]|nr:MAG: hypothetical protein AMJ79_10035 [Phycisphaerae bacterium SM23_30]